MEPSGLRLQGTHMNADHVGDLVTALTVSMAFEHLKPLLPRQVMQHLQPWQQEAEEQLHKLNSSKFQGWIDKVRIAPQHFLQAPQVDAEAVGVNQALSKGLF